MGRSAVSVNGSRGSVIDKAENLQKFGVFGNYKVADGEEFGSNWFNNVPVTYSSKDAKWTYSPVLYWLPQGHIDFLAYAPYAKGTTLNNTSIDFTVAGEVANQKDLLWANAKDQTKANNSGAGKKVKFQFAHALSRLGYTVKLKENYTGATIKLTKITLAGSSDGTTGAFYTKGTIDLSKTSPSTDLWKPSTSEAKQKFDWFSGDQTLATTTDYNNPNTDYLFVIPQNFSAATDKLYVIVEYTIEGYNNVTTPMTNKVYKQLDYEFEQGKAYTINLTIGLTPIEFDADVTPWDPAAGTSIDINSWN